MVGVVRRGLRADLPERGGVCCAMDKSHAGGAGLAAVQPALAGASRLGGCGGSMAGECGSPQSFHSLNI